MSNGQPLLGGLSESGGVEVGGGRAVGRASRRVRGESEQSKAEVRWRVVGAEVLVCVESSVEADVRDRVVVR